MKKSNSIYFWRIFFTYMIAMFHFDNGYRILCFDGAYIAADFFFLVSGYLLYKKSISVNAPKNAVEYTLGRYKRLYKQYLFGFVLVFLAVYISGKRGLSLLGLLWDSKGELLLLQGLEMGRGWNLINPTLWFLSVMIISGFVLYVCLCHFEKLFLKFLAPLCLVYFFYMFYVNVGSLDAAVNLEGVKFNYPLLRGFGEMTLGVYGVILNEKISKSSLSKYASWMSAGFFVAAVVVAYVWGKSQIDFVAFVLLFGGVAFGFCEKDSNVLSGDRVKRLSAMTINIYIIHELFRTYIIPAILPKSDEPWRNWFAFLVYILMVTAAGVLMEVILKKVKA